MVTPKLATCAYSVLVHEPFLVKTGCDCEFDWNKFNNVCLYISMYIIGGGGGGEVLKNVDSTLLYASTYNLNLLYFNNPHQNGQHININLQIYNF